MSTTIPIRMCITARAPAHTIPTSPAASTHGLPFPRGRTEPPRNHPARRRVVADVVRSVSIVGPLWIVEATVEIRVPDHLLMKRTIETDLYQGRLPTTPRFALR